MWYSHILAKSTRIFSYKHKSNSDSINLDNLTPAQLKFGITLVFLVLNQKSKALRFTDATFLYTRGHRESTYWACIQKSDKLLM